MPPRSPVPSKKPNPILPTRNKIASRRVSLSDKYFKYLGVGLSENIKPIHASPNNALPLHGWAPYIQGFSAKFVEECLHEHKLKEDIRVLDPFVGNGTVALVSKWGGVASCGIECNPLLYFIARTKSEAHLADIDLFKKWAGKVLRNTKRASAPDFLATKNQFSAKSLESLEKIKGGIDSITASNAREKRAKNLLRLALSAILIHSSRLVRTPCLTYRPSKRVNGEDVRRYFHEKTNQMIWDIEHLQKKPARYRKVPCEIRRENSISLKHDSKYDLVITSPPYMNGMDYIINYKIEMSWLDFVESQKELKKIKDNMVACDNVSRSLARNYNGTSPNEWVDDIRNRVADSIRNRGFYRRDDMPDIINKYFHDMKKALKHIADALLPGGKIIMVVGDSLIAGVHVPTDLILARICMDDSGLSVQRIEKARNRRSGQQRNYLLRETVLVIEKPV